MLILGIQGAFAAMPEGGTGGNGQLVVIPQRGSKPVPYEVARSWDTGVYRNFYKMPGVDGSIEPRSRFNKQYGVYAQDWMKLIKEYSSVLYQELDEAAKSTIVRFMDNLIIWEHEAYPKDGSDYKKFEKAAFYNGEIIFSIPVMEKMGAIENILSKEENQGFVVIHELINSAYKERLTVAQRLNLGEIIVNLKLKGISKSDFHQDVITRIESAWLIRKENPEFILETFNNLGEKGFRKRLVEIYPSLSEINEFYPQLKDRDIEAIKNYALQVFDKSEGTDLERLLEARMKLQGFEIAGLINNLVEKHFNLCIEHIFKERNLSLDLDNLRHSDKEKNHYTVLEDDFNLIRLRIFNKVDEDILKRINNFKTEFSDETIFLTHVYNSITDEKDKPAQGIIDFLIKSEIHRYKQRYYYDYNEDDYKKHLKNKKDLFLPHLRKKLEGIGLLQNYNVRSLYNYSTPSTLKVFKKKLCSPEEINLSYEETYSYFELKRAGRNRGYKILSYALKVIKAENQKRVGKIIRLKPDDLDSCNEFVNINDLVQEF